MVIAWFYKATISHSFEFGSHGKLQLIKNMSSHDNSWKAFFWEGSLCLEHFYPRYRWPVGPCKVATILALTLLWSYINKILQDWISLFLPLLLLSGELWRVLSEMNPTLPPSVGWETSCLVSPPPFLSFLWPKVILTHHYIAPFWFTQTSWSIPPVFGS